MFVCFFADMSMHLPPQMRLYTNSICCFLPFVHDICPLCLFRDLQQHQALFWSAIGRYFYRWDAASSKRQRAGCDVACNRTAGKECGRRHRRLRRYASGPLPHGQALNHGQGAAGDFGWRPHPRARRVPEKAQVRQDHHLRPRVWAVLSAGNTASNGTA